MKHPSASAGDTEMQGQEDPSEEEREAHSCIPAWKIPWTEKLSGYSPWGHKESDTTEHTHGEGYSEFNTFFI